MLVLPQLLGLDSIDVINYRSRGTEAEWMTHHVERVDDDGVDVRARRLVRDLGDGVHDVRPEAELEHALHDAGLVEHGVDEEDDDGA